METRLRELTMASRKRVGPKNFSLKFSGFQVRSSSGSSKTMGASLIMLAVVYPLASAAEYRKGLNEEPGCRLVCMARLNLLRL